MSSPPNNNQLAEPFSQIFVDWAEAEWAFEWLQETVRRLRITGPADPRVAVTLTQRSGRRFLRLIFGGWLVLGFRSPGQSPERVDLTLLAHLVQWDERLAPYNFEAKEGRPEVRSYALPPRLVRPLTSDLRQAYEATLDFIAAKFEGWRGTPHARRHHPEIIEALFDPERRTHLLAGGLAELELQYERHFTAFPYDAVAEEEGLYEVEEIGVEEMGR